MKPKLIRRPFIGQVSEEIRAASETRDRHIAAAVFNHPWAISQAKLREIATVVRRHMAGAQLSEDEIRAAIGASQIQPAQQGNGIAVIPVYGVLAYRMDMMTAVSGGTSLQRLKGLMVDAARDSSVGTIVLRFETPGGSVDGLTEMAATIRDLRGKGTKQIVAAIDVRALSAGYWLASQCDEICCTPSGYAGCIGIVTEYCDDSEAMKMEGEIVELISVPEKKAAMMQPGPLSADRRARMMDVMSQFYGMFIGDVAKGRGVSAARVKADFGDGDILTAQEAKAAGMIDRIETFDATLARLGTKGGSMVSVRADSGGSSGDLAAVALAPSTLMAGVVPKSISEDLAPKDEAWSAPTLADFTDQSWGDLSDMDKNTIAEHYAWAKQLPPAAFSDLKLPHHQPKGGAVVYRAVVAALGRLDAMSDIPAADKPHVKAHLEHHEQQFAAAAAPAKASALQADDVIIEIDDDDDGCEQCAPDCPCEMDECAPGCETCAPACACGQPAGQADVTDESDSAAAAAAVVAASCGD